MGFKKRTYCDHASALNRAKEMGKWRCVWIDGALPANTSCENRAEAVPPEPDSFMAKVDAALEQQVLNISQRQWEPDVHHYHQADDVGR